MHHIQHRSWWRHPFQINHMAEVFPSSHLNLMMFLNILIFRNYLRLWLTIIRIVLNILWNMPHCKDKWYYNIISKFMDVSSSYLVNNLRSDIHIKCWCSKLSYENILHKTENWISPTRTATFLLSFQSVNFTAYFPDTLILWHFKQLVRLYFYLFNILSLPHHCA